MKRMIDKLDDDFLDEVDRQSRLLAWIGIIAALVFIIIPALLKIIP